MRDSGVVVAEIEPPSSAAPTAAAKQAAKAVGEEDFNPHAVFCGGCMWVVVKEACRQSGALQTHVLHNGVLSQLQGVQAGALQSRQGQGGDDSQEYHSP